jgi:hypothetical protein
MLPFDSIVTANAIALTMKAPCVRQFHDPGQQVGKAIAQSLGAQDKVAWDIYLFYSKGVGWNNNLPSPLTWAHQLSPSDWADPARYHGGDDLVEELLKGMGQLSVLQ